MKVLIFITSISLKGGGPSRSVPMLVKGLADVGVDVTLMTCRSEDMNTHALERTTAKLYVQDAFEAADVRTYIGREKFDLIQIQSMWDLRYHELVKIAQQLNIPYIITPRGMLEPWSLSQKKWKKRLAMMLYQKADLQKSVCIYTTAEMEAQHVRELGIKVPMSVIPNGIETEDYPCRTTMDIVKKQVLFLSRIHVKKGIEHLINVWSRMKVDFPDWKVVIVGNGEAEYIDSLKLRVKSSGLEDCVEINDPVFGQAKVELYQSSSLFVLPSYSENFGMVIAEAMSCGVPALTTTNCPWEILNKTKTGWCISLHEEILENTMREALSMPAEELYDKGQKASKLVNEHFNYRNVAKRTAELYEWIVNGGSMPGFVTL